MLTIRQIQPNDWKLLKLLRLTALADSPEAFDETLEEANRIPDSVWKAKAERDSKGKESICALAFNHTEPIGMVAGFLDHDDRIKAHLAAMWLDSRFRGIGIGERLIRFISDWADTAGAIVLTGDMHAQDPRAQAFYLKNGFKLLHAQNTLASAPGKSQIRIKKILRSRETNSKSDQPFLKEDIQEAPERRADLRQGCFIPVTFTYKDRVYREIIRNISRGGVYIYTKVLIPVKTDLSLIFRYPGHGSAKRMGRVVRTDPGGMAIQLQ